MNVVFITSKRSFGPHDEQKASGKFLALFSRCGEGVEEFNLADYEEKYRPALNSKGKCRIWAVVRKCSMTQCGHFMMGKIRVGSQSLSMSGSYGADGLTGDLSDIEPENRRFLTEVPEDLVCQFWAGGGHNCAGNEAIAMVEWAKKNLVKKGGSY